MAAAPVPSGGWGRRLRLAQERRRHTFLYLEILGFVPRGQPRAGQHQRLCKYYDKFSPSRYHLSHFCYLGWDQVPETAIKKRGKI